MAWNGSISAGMVVGYRETGRVTMRAQSVDQSTSE
jgi:hypothetical protein